MSHFSVNCPPWWNSNNQRVAASSSENLSLKMASLSSQLSDNAKQLGLQVQDQDSSSTQSSSQSQQDLASSEGTTSQDGSVPLKSGQDEAQGRHMEGTVKPLLCLGNPNSGFHPTQVDYSHSMAPMPYPYTDPYLSRMLTHFGTQTIIQPQMLGMTAPARVPLPLDVAEDGPIYVNAKQYHGILRRRQSRARLEAQNKLVKARKPYLHESRHLHALNRVRGSGGRFLSTKKTQQSNPDPTNTPYALNSVRLHQKKNTRELEANHRSDIGGRSGGGGASTTCSDITGDGILWPSNRRFSDHHAPVVR